LRSDVLASSSSSVWYIEALPDDGYLFPWTPYVLAPGTGAFSYNILTANVDGVGNAPNGSVTSTLKLRSEVWRDSAGALQGYDGCLGQIDLGTLAGSVLDGIINGGAGAVAGANTLAGSSGWVRAGLGASTTPGFLTATFYKWTIVNPTVSVAGWGTGFVLRDISFSIEMREVVLTYLQTGPAPSTVPAGTTGRLIQTTPFSHSQSLTAMISQ
jgi:hypothetical protein